MKSFTDRTGEAVKSFYREFGINLLLSGDYRGSLIAESALWYAMICSRRIIYRENRRRSEIILQGVWDQLITVW